MSHLCAPEHHLRLPGRPQPEGRLRAVLQRGPSGVSAYEQWLAAGNVGSPADFLQSLKAPIGTYLEYEQAVPALVWDIPHGFGRRPSVDVVDTAGDPILLLPRYPDLNTVRLTFSVPTAGFAYLN